MNVIAENYGSEENPVPTTARATAARCCSIRRASGATRPFTEDFQMEVTNPAWSAPIRKGDRIRISGTYENKEHAWYDG